MKKKIRNISSINFKVLKDRSPGYLIIPLSNGSLISARMWNGDSMSKPYFFQIQNIPRDTSEFGPSKKF